MDITRAWYEASVNYRPSRHLTLKGELRREDIDRSNTGPEEPHSGFADPVQINPNWLLPEEETITRAKTRLQQSPAGEISVQAERLGGYPAQRQPRIRHLLRGGPGTVSLHQLHPFAVLGLSGQRQPAAPGK